jgi:hypothetical protein
MQIRRSDHTRARRHRRTSWTCFLRKGWRSHYHPSLAVTAFLWIDSLREGKLGPPNHSRRCHIPMTIDDNLMPFSLAAVRRKKITAAFDGGRLTSDGGVMLLAGRNALKSPTSLRGDRRSTRPSCCSRAFHPARPYSCHRFAGHAAGDDLDQLRSDPASSWPAATCRTVGVICVRSRPCRVGRTPPRCGRLSS